MKRLLIAAALVFSGCATEATRTQTVEVKVPVAVHPVDPKDVPQIPAPLGPRPKDARAALDVSQAQVCRFVAYALKADPLLRISAGLPPLEPAKFPECER